MNIPQWLRSLLMTSVVFVIVSSAPSRSCHPCSCENGVANCKGLNLTDIPRLPSSNTVLYLSSNNLGNLTSETFLNVKTLRLRTLIIDNCRIQTVQKKTFTTLKYIRYLKELDMSGNKFISLTKTLQSLTGLNLTFLNLSSGEIHFSDFNRLRPLSKMRLRTLDLTGNSLKTLKGELSVNLPFLQTLILKRNNITKVEWDDVHTKLNYVDLSDNILSSIPSLCISNSTMSALPNLKNLSLSNNYITTLEELNKSIACMSKLRKLEMDFNPLTLIANNAFTKLPELRILSLDMLNSHRIFLQPNAFSSSSLEELTFGTYITKVMPPNAGQMLFANCPNLYFLKITGLDFHKWNSESIRKLFEQLHKIKFLTLEKTLLGFIPSNLLPNMSILEYLSFRGNFLSTWNRKAFINATSLKTLILSVNHITQINETSFPDFLLQNLQTLDLAFNPFDCSCELYWFRQWLKTNSEKVEGYPDVYFCKSPSKYKNWRLVKYDPSYLECHPIKTYEIVLIVFGCVIATLTGVLIIINKYKWHMKYYIYLIHARRGYKKIPENGEFAYDAFVAYNTSDRVWVISQLVPFLEKQKQMKLCLHERDFNAGRLIVDNIIENIRISRKVILILSNEFAKSQWCQFETLMAQHRFVEDGASSLVLVMLEDVCYRHLNGPLNCLLQSMTYIQWTTEPVGKTLFWNKLVASLE